jgi:hypothetical protein
MCYPCKKCGKKYKYAIDLIGDFGADFGKCPVCGSDGDLTYEGPVSPETSQYEEVD